ncbi:hypothetical protein NE619_01270 [Anaerovorax odorimutans]|uniref:Uncharacterized protein n=1 Tax=Anaerovorax odorimutans TaxID=109327 RepID=A0ABT1RJH9_9FIRM|nr:hypothetical protein [Anaerovorax odorimutans]MCQ4635346.1 hypothetical protein [Anaerovorax odorimutans]
MKKVQQNFDSLLHVDKNSNFGNYAPLFAKSYALCNDSAAFETACSTKFHFLRFRTPANPHLCVTSHHFYEKVTAARKAAWIQSSRRRNIVWRIRFAALPRGLFEQYAYFVQHRIHFACIVDTFPRVSASTPVQFCILTEILYPHALVSLKKVQQNFDSLLHVDKNSNFGNHGPLFAKSYALCNDSAAFETACSTKFHFLRFRTPANPHLCVTSHHFYEKVTAARKAAWIQSGRRRNIVWRIRFAALPRGLFQQYAYFVQHRIHFACIVDTFPRVSASTPVQFCILAKILYPHALASLKKVQQNFDSLLHVDKNSNFGNYAPLFSKSYALCNDSAAFETACSTKFHFLRFRAPANPHLCVTSHHFYEKVTAARKVEYA